MSSAPRRSRSRTRIGDPATSAYALISRAMAIWGPRAAFEHAGARGAGDRAWRQRRATRSTSPQLVSTGSQSIFATGPPGPGASGVRGLPRDRRGAAPAVAPLVRGPHAHVDALARGQARRGRGASGADVRGGHEGAVVGRGRRPPPRARARCDGSRVGSPSSRSDLIEAGVAVPGLPPVPLRARPRLPRGRAAGRGARARRARSCDGGEETLPHDNGWAYGMTMLAEIVAAARRRGARRDALRRDAALRSPHGDGRRRDRRRVARAVARSARRRCSADTDDALAHFDASARGAPRVPRRHLGHPHRRRRGRGATAAWHRRGPPSRGAACCRRRARSVDAEDGTGSRHASTSSSGEPGRGVTPPGGLTRREVEVARLVARGRSNREIAEEFVLSERTVESHVQHILTKLGFTSRAEIAAWVVRSGLDGTG